MTPRSSFRLHPSRRSLHLLLAALLSISATGKSQDTSHTRKQIGKQVHQSQPWPLWESYRASAIDPTGRVIDHSAADHTTSEGQSYALFFALIANDRPHFDAVLHWTETNLCAGNLEHHLPYWNWGKKPDGNWGPLDPNSASDSDLWIAYDLIEAGRLWHDAHLTQIGRSVAGLIAEHEVAAVPGLGRTLLPGSQGFHPASDTWILNPSYLPPPLLLRLAAVMPQGPWSDVLASLRPMLAGGSGGNFAMDWIEAGPALKPGSPPNSGTAPVGSYDAIRVYLWLGFSDRATPGLKDLLHAVSGMAAYMRSSEAPPEKVDAHGAVVSRNSPVGFSAALIPYLQAVGMTAASAAQTRRVNLARNPQSGLVGPSGSYYDQNLALFATGWAEHRFRFDPHGQISVTWHP